MTPAEILAPELADTVEKLRAQDKPFAFATIVRTVGSTAAKPGAKALLGADGSILQGWLGGGCTRGAVRKATLEAFQTGSPKFVSVAPEEILSELGVEPGEEIEGQRFARNGCPSKGSVDIFIEPFVPAPVLTVLGASPVAEALIDLAERFHWSIATDIEPGSKHPPVIVIATQGQGDLDALISALNANPRHVAFVGSRRKFETLAQKLADRGVGAGKIGSVEAPAGLSIGAVTPEEIALSILAQLVQVRRQGVKAMDQGVQP